MPSLWERLYGLATMPEEQAQGQVRGILSGVVGGVAETVKVPGQMMTPNPYPPGSEEAAFFDASKTAKAADWAPEMALNTMGTGAIAGVPVKGAEQVLGAGIIRPKPLIGGYHGTGSPTDFSSFQLPPPTHDLGIHTTIDPNVAAQYARNKPSFQDSLSHLQNPDYHTQAHARTVPVVADIQNPLKLPFDAGKWNLPDNVIQPLEEAIAKGGRYKAPRGILEDMRNISGSEQTWQSQFAPMLKDRGYDSVLYPHFNDYITTTVPRNNTFMTFDPAQTVPRFSPEGYKLAMERGVHEPMKKDYAYAYGELPDYKLPRGLLKKVEDPEPFGPAREIVEARQKKWKEDYDAEFNKSNTLQSFHEVQEKFKNKEITGEQFWKEYDKLFNKK